MTDAPARCIAATPDDPAPCEGPHDAVLIRGAFMSRARDAVTEPVPACVRHGGHLFGVLHAGRVLAAFDEGRITPGPGGTKQSVRDTLVRVLSVAHEATPGEPARCPAAAVPVPDGTECDGPHDAVLVRARFSARIRHGLDGDVPGCVHHGARLLVVSNGGAATPGPGGTEQDAKDVRQRAEAAWGALAAPGQDPPAADTFHPDLAGTVHYVDPRVRRLAQAAWRLDTGGTYQEWLTLGKDNPDALIREARDWTRAAVAAGILPPPAP